MGVTTGDEVDAADIVIVSGLALLLLTAAMVVPVGMPVPVIGCPTSSPLTLETPEMTVLPLVRMPVGVTWLEVEAPAVPLIVIELAPTAVM